MMIVIMLISLNLFFLTDSHTNILNLNMIIITNLLILKSSGISYRWLARLTADFHSVEFSDWTGNPLFFCENGAVILNTIPRVTYILFSKIQSARKILRSGNQPLA